MAELDGHLAGHIMFTKTYVAQPDGSKYDVLMVAPLSVLLEHRNKGVGSALMEEGFRIAEASGYEAAFLLGDPNYYQRFGYKPSHLYGIGHGVYPAEYLLAKEIISGALKNVTGTVNM